MINKIKTKLPTGRRNLFTSEELSQMNEEIKAGATHAQIVRAYNMSKGTLLNLVRKKKLAETSFKFNDNSLKEIKELRAQKVSYEQIARKLNMSVSYLFKLKKKGKL